MYRTNCAKPCFHPLTTAAGVVLTDFEPPDHAWHRGLWFAIKYINGVNFWEEGHDAGRQETIGKLRVDPFVGDSGGEGLRIEHQLRWAAATAGEVLRETRTLALQELDGGAISIHWKSELQALQDLVLERKPYTAEEGWGGYSGLSFRASPALLDTQVIFPDGGIDAVFVGKSGQFVVMEGQSQRGKVWIKLENEAGNPCQGEMGPGVPWYGKAVPDYRFINAAFLFHGGMRMAKSERLSFGYRCLFGDGDWRDREITPAAGEPMPDAVT